MNKTEKAVSTFESGYNCTQAVVLAFAEEIGIDLDFLLRFSCGFGSGMGRLQQTCGAVSGAFMVLGAKHGMCHTYDADKKIETYELVSEFSEIFVKRNSSLNCRDIIACDLSTEAGRKYFDDNNIKDTVCRKCVTDTVDILEDLL